MEERGVRGARGPVVASAPEQRAAAMPGLSSLSPEWSQPSSWSIPAFCQEDQIQDILKRLQGSLFRAQHVLGRCSSVTRNDQGNVWVDSGIPRAVFIVKAELSDSG